jgi:putative redox protein
MTDDTHDENLRSVEISRIGPARFKATNARGGETFFGTGGEDPDFTPVELLLAAIAGCSALDVEAITHKRTSSTTFDVHAEGRKVRDEHGNHLTGLRVSFDVAFPEGPDGDAARERVQAAVEMSRDRLCTVSRTVQLGADVVYDPVSRS